MQENEMNQFSWTTFFLVTGISFVLFSKLLQLIDGNRLPVFTTIGIFAILLGSLNSIVKLLERTEEK